MVDIAEETDWNDVDVTDSEETESDDNFAYEISHYPADITLEGYRTRHEKGTLRVPKFQRKYVWDQVRASKLIESFLLGLPVPGVFLYKERNSNDLLIIDGQQRIMTAIKFFNERFDENRIFKLKNVREPWNGKTFSELSGSDQSQLEDMVLRATVIQQIDPQDDSSIYHIFERLNTGGIRLNAMEVRRCLFEGPTMDSIENMNSDPNWRKIIGKPKLDPRLRDAELILRVIALAHNWRNYEKPMKMFLNQFLSGRKRMNSDAISDVIERENSNFIQLCEKIYLSAGEKPFHLRGRLNYAFLDSFMAVTFAHAEVDANALGRALEDLKGDEEYVRLCTYNTSDESVLKARFEKSELAVTNATRQN